MFIIYKIKRLFQNSLTIIVSLFVLCLILELNLRFYHKIKYKVPFFASLEHKRYSSSFGWIGTEIMGDLSSKKFKIFFVGDSYTEGSVGIKDLYYSIVKRNLDIELFVYGAAGYGTLQEFLVIDRYINFIKPDLVILQVTDNDFFDNLWDLDFGCLTIRTLTRPYYKDGKIKFLPAKRLFCLRYLQPHIRLINFVLVRIDALYTIPDFIKIWNDIEKRDLESKQFQESVAITSELINKIKSRCGMIPLISFIVTDKEPYFTQFKAIFKNADIDFIEKIPQLIRGFEIKNGVDYKAKDKVHWDEKGNRICAEYLTAYLKKYILDKK